jgi:hypothetical protein
MAAICNVHTSAKLLTLHPSGGPWAGSLRNDGSSSSSGFIGGGGGALMGYVDPMMEGFAGGGGGGGCSGAVREETDARHPESGRAVKVGVGGVT